MSNRVDTSSVHNYFVCNHAISGPSYMEMKANSRTLCQVCGAIAKGVYYTATSCKSCMDFFRRCVIYNKQYKVSFELVMIAG